MHTFSAWTTRPPQRCPSQLLSNVWGFNSSGKCGQRFVMRRNRTSLTVTNMAAPAKLVGWQEVMAVNLTVMLQGWHALIGQALVARWDGWGSRPWHSWCGWQINWTTRGISSWLSAWWILMMLCWVSWLVLTMSLPHSLCPQTSLALRPHAWGSTWSFWGRQLCDGKLSWQIQLQCLQSFSTDLLRSVLERARSLCQQVSPSVGEG